MLDKLRAPASPERRDRPPLDQSGQDRGYGHGSPDFSGGVGFHDDGTYNRGPIRENAWSQTRSPHSQRLFFAVYGAWFCKGADVTSLAEYEVALRQLEEDPPAVRHIREEGWTHFSLEGVRFPTTTVDVIQRGEALAIFERDLVIHFQQISRAAALYIRALLGGVKRILEIYRR